MELIIGIIKLFFISVIIFVGGLVFTKFAMKLVEVLKGEKFESKRDSISDVEPTTKPK